MWIHERIFERARQQSEQTAIVLGQTQWTYGYLADLSETLVQAFLKLFEPGTCIALYMTKSPQAIAIMLSCLRAGMVYVPIDPKCPAERRDLILEDCQAQLLVLDNFTATQWNKQPSCISALTLIISPQAISLTGIQQFSLDEFLARDDFGENIRPYPPITADTLAYLLYTSGSTGVPKGVKITHANARAFVDWAYEQFNLNVHDHIAVHAPLHFDLPVFDIYVGLAKGATLYLIDEQTTLFPEALFRFLRAQAITVLYAVPSALTALVHRSSLRNQDLPALRYLLYAGEEFHPSALRILMSKTPAARVFNLYGPIETNVVTYLEVMTEHLDLPRIPLGHPISTTRLLLLGENQQVIEQGEGEVVICGPSVTPGYLNHAEKTEATRCTIPMDGYSQVCYQTGDFARRDANGMLHFLGRRDGLIKTRGFRVELGDVEAALLKIFGVDEAAAFAVPHKMYTNLLYAFIVVKKSEHIDEASLLQELMKHLPSYMYPQRLFLRLDFPKTSTGKIARRELQEELKSVLFDHKEEAAKIVYST